MQRPEFLSTGEPARLIPVVADTSREQRAASILLAALRSVHEFRQSMLRSLGVRVGNRTRLEAWTEVTLKNDQPKGHGKRPKETNDRPDGLILVDTSRQRWSALIEAKIGNAEVGEEQLRHYLEQARQHGINAVITLTNQFVALPSHHPVKVPKKLLRGVELYHWSWMYIVTQATLLLEDEAVASEDQRYILEEVLRYLGHESSGISRFDRMNREWRDVVGKVQSGATLGKTAEETENTVSCWHQEQRDLCLLLSRKLGRPVQLKLARGHRTDPGQRLRDDCELLAREKALRCTVDIPDTAAPLDVRADLTKRTISCGMRLAAPQDKKRASSRVHWLTRQLAKANPEGMFVKAIRPGRAEETQAPLAEVLQDATVLESPTTNVVPSAFEVFYLVDLAGRFAGNKVFIEELERAVPHFYEQIGQRLRAWVPPPPKISRKNAADGTETQEREEDEAVASEAGDISSRDQ